MRSKKITKQIQSVNFKDSVESGFVRGKFFNDLKFDWDAHIPSDGVANLDTVNEYTSATGVTLDGVLLKDSTIALNSLVTEHVDVVTMTAAQITAAGVGGFAHANGLVLVEGVGTGYVLEFVSALLVYDGDGTGYTAGGDVTINIGGGGAALTGLVSAANSFGNAGDRIYMFKPLSTAAISLPVNTSINIVSSVAFTNVGVSGATAKVHIAYRVHATGL